jgi:hypothetical protein
MNSFTKNPATAAFFSYVNDWFYREFSQVSHGSLPGLIHTVGALRDLAKGDTAKLEQLRGYHFHASCDATHHVLLGSGRRANNWGG